MGGVALLAIGSGPAFAEIVDKIVANVNGSIILLSDVKKQYEALREMKARGQIDMADEDISERKILDTIIDEKILAAHAKERDMEIKESEIDNTIKGIQERNNLDDESFRQILKNQGSSMAEFRERVKNQILTQRVVSLEVDMVNPTEEEAREYYETNKSQYVGEGKVKVRHILILVSAEGGMLEAAMALDKITQIKNKIGNGEDFGQMAREHSDDPSGKNGGEIGWIGRGEVVPAFEKTAYSLEEGNVSEPVRTGFGYHLIQVMEKKIPEPVPFAKVADKIKDMLTQQAFERKKDAWLALMREQAFIEIMY